MFSVLNSVQNILESNFKPFQFHQTIYYFDTPATLTDLLAYLSTFDEGFLLEHQADVHRCFSALNLNQIAARFNDLCWDYKEECAAGLWYNSSSILIFQILN